MRCSFQLFKPRPKKRFSHLRRRYKQQSGSAVVDVMLGLIIFAGFFSVLYDQNRAASQMQSASMAGQDLALVVDGVSQYLRDSTNFDTALTAAKADSDLMTEIDFADIVDDGFLPENTANFNNYGQDYKIFARNLAAHPDGLEVILITEGGEPIPSKYINMASRYAGVRGGYIGGDNYFGDEGIAQGAAGWTLDITSDYPDAVPSGGEDEMTGRLVGLVWFNGQGGTGDFLARMPSSDPEANTMRTDIIMGNNNILDANIISAQDYVIREKTYQGAAKTASEAVHDVFISTGNQLIDKPICPSPMVPKIYTSLTKFESSTGSGAVMSGAQAYAENVSATQWRVRIQVLGEDDRTWTDVPNSARATATVIVKCGLA